MRYNKHSIHPPVQNPHAHLSMDNNTSSSWDMSMGNQFLDSLPSELPYSLQDPLQPHQIPSSSHVANSCLPKYHLTSSSRVPNSSVQIYQGPSSSYVPNSSVQTFAMPSSSHGQKSRLQTHQEPSSSNVSSSSFTTGYMGEGEEEEEEEEEGLGPMKEMMYKIAAMQPVDIDPATIRKPKRRNVRISDDPQSVAARHRRERISERIRILQRLVPGGTKMDTASMLDEAIRYVKFLKRQVHELQSNQYSPSVATIGHLPTGEWPARPAGMGASSAMAPPGGEAFRFAGDGKRDNML